MKNKSGLLVYFIFVLLLVGAALWISTSAKPQSVYTMDEFKAAVKDGNVVSLTIVQNREVPTGVVTVAFNDHSSNRFNVSDVNDVENYAEKNEIPYLVKDVPKESWFVKYVLPALIVVVAIVFIYAMMHGAAAGGPQKMRQGQAHRPGADHGDPLHDQRSRTTRLYCGWVKVSRMASAKGVGVMPKSFCMELPVK